MHLPQQVPKRALLAFYHVNGILQMVHSYAVTSLYSCCCCDVHDVGAKCLHVIACIPSHPSISTCGESARLLPLEARNILPVKIQARVEGEEAKPEHTVLVSIKASLADVHEVLLTQKGDKKASGVKLWRHSSRCFGWLLLAMCSWRLWRARIFRFSTLTYKTD